MKLKNLTSFYEKIKDYRNKREEHCKLHKTFEDNNKNIIVTKDKLKLDFEQSIDNLFEKLKIKEENKTNTNKILKDALMERSKEDLADILVSASISNVFLDTFFYILLISKMFKDINNTYETI